MRASALVSKSALLTVFCLANWVQMSGAWGDPALTTLYAFSGNDGANPQGRLIFDKSGALYGTTSGGGTNNYGTAFKLTPPATTGGAWSESVMHSFGLMGNDGIRPFAGLIFDKSGALYGTTGAGGSPINPGRCPAGCGTVFKLTPPARPGGAWTETVLHSFTADDGAEPSGDLIIDESGALYGTAAYGGPYSVGTVFKLAPPVTTGGAWTATVLHSFSGGDGAGPLAGLIFDKSGALYGTTSGGGADGDGTVFKLTPPTTTGGTWTETVLHSFSGGDGAFPYAVSLIFDESGALYGTTQLGGEGCSFDIKGCGTAFKLTPPARTGGAWTETVLHSFRGSDGYQPLASLIFGESGVLYSTTVYGGAGCPSISQDGCGTVFKLTPPTTTGGAWTETVLHSFTSGDGGQPFAGLIFGESGALYGTTFAGAGGTLYGTVFKLTAVVTFVGTRGKANCYGQSVSALARQYGGLNAAAAALGYYDVSALQNAIMAFCED